MNDLINEPRPAPGTLVQGRTSERPWTVLNPDQPRERRRGSTSSL